MRRLAIFSTIGAAHRQVSHDYIPVLLEGVRPHVDTLVVSTTARDDCRHFTRVTEICDRLVPDRDQGGSLPDKITFVGARKAAMLELGREYLSQFDEVLLFDSSNFGPLRELTPFFAEMDGRDCDIWAVNHFNPAHDKRFRNETETRPIVPNMDFICFRRAAFEDPDFWDFWENVDADAGDWGNFVNGELALLTALIEKGKTVSYYVDPAGMRTAQPSIMEALEMLKAGSPVLTRNLVTADPLVSEMQALDGRRVLDWIEENTDYDTNLVWESLLRHYPLRQIHTNLEEIRVLDDGPACHDRTEWSFGKVAVFAHVFYANMTDEFIERVKMIPGEVAFFATTASEEHKIAIEKRVVELGFTGYAEIRVVEQNRGRDMSSLFITFRDVVLGGEYGFCLRLHSKRTPQMSAQIGQSFKDHMFENLVPSRGFVSRLFDLAEKYPNIGVFIPPTVHIGYGTLGHSWFANRGALYRLILSMGMKLPLDKHTPIAAYGTMYWFRPEALRPIFEREWKWEEYNAEPNHLDGGLAHVQERLICYTAQWMNYRTMSVMNPSMASRNYTKLEYKFQTLASYYPNGDIRQMIRLAEMENKGRTPMFSVGRFFVWVQRSYDRTQETWPWFWRVTQPIVPKIWPFMSGVIQRSRS